MSFERLPRQPGPPAYPAGYLDLVCPNDECPGTTERHGIRYRYTWTISGATEHHHPERRDCSECGTEGVEQGTIDSSITPTDDEWRERDQALEALAIQYDSVHVQELPHGHARARCYDDTPGGQTLVATYIVNPDGRTIGQ